MPIATPSSLSHELIDVIKNKINSLSPELYALSQSIHSQPETAFEEYHAHRVLTDFMESKGFKVTRHAYGLRTAWRAELEVGTGGPIIGYNSEFDALKGIGHACGHNLIAIAGVAAAISTASALSSSNTSGKVVLLGTPAEENGGGKAVILDEGGYEGMEACLMLHPFSKGDHASTITMNCLASVEVEYEGSPAHAAGFPEQGVNALDAAVSAYQSVSLLRQQTPDKSRIHGVIRGCEDWSTNVIPSTSKISFGIRSPTAKETLFLLQKVLNCFKAAALATGCTHTIRTEMRYLDLRNADVMEDYWSEVSESVCDTKVQRGLFSGGSTDFGTVSYHLPCLHPLFGLPDANPEDVPHTKSYAAAAGTKSAHQATMRASVGIAVVGTRIITDKTFREDVKKGWVAQMRDLNAKETLEKLQELKETYSPVGMEGSIKGTGGCACGH